MSITALLGSLGAGIPVLIGFLTGWTFVEQGSRAVHLRCGSAFTRRGRFRTSEPGWLWIIPFIDKVKSFHTARRQVETRAQELWSVRYGFVNVTGFIAYRVVTDQALWFAVCELDGNLDGWIHAGFSSMLGTVLPQWDLSKEELENQLFLNLRQYLWAYGLEVTEVRLPGFSITFAAQAAQLFPPYRSNQLPADRYQPQPISSNGNGAHVTA